MEYLDKVDRISKLEKTIEMTRELYASEDTTIGEKECLDIIFYRLHREMFQLTVDLDYELI